MKKFKKLGVKVEMITGDSEDAAAWVSKELGNVIALPLAASVLASKEILMQPALAAVFMSLSMIIMAFNAVLLRKQKL